MKPHKHPKEPYTFGIYFFMPSIYERIKTLRYTTLTREQKVTIGKLVADEYFKLPPKNRPFLYKKKSHEPDGTFDVWIYPKRFIVKMDLIINNQCHEWGLRSSRRKRLEVAKKVTSSTRR